MLPATAPGASLALVTPPSATLMVGADVLPPTAIEASPAPTEVTPPPPAAVPSPTSTHPSEVALQINNCWPGAASVLISNSLLPWHVVGVSAINTAFTGKV